ELSPSLQWIFQAREDHPVLHRVFGQACIHAAFCQFHLHGRGRRADAVNSRRTFEYFKPAVTDQARCTATRFDAEANHEITFTAAVEGWRATVRRDDDRGS